MSLGISMYRAEDLGEHLPARRHLRMFRSKGFLADLKRTTNEPLGFPIVALDSLKHGNCSHRHRRNRMLVPQDFGLSSKAIASIEDPLQHIVSGKPSVSQILQDDGDVTMI